MMPRVLAKEGWADGLNVSNFDITGSQWIKPELLEMNVFARSYIKQ